MSQQIENLFKPYTRKDSKNHQVEYTIKATDSHLTGIVPTLTCGNHTEKGEYTGKSSFCSMGIIHGIPKPVDEDHIVVVGRSIMAIARDKKCTTLYKNATFHT